MDATVKKLRTRPEADIGRGPGIIRPSREEAEEAVRTLIAYAGDDPDREGLRETPRRVTAAYDEFLKGQEIRNSGTVDLASFRKAMGFYEQAVALDPDFAQAWAGVSLANSFLYADSTPTPALAERSRQAAEKAVLLAPTSPDGYIALGIYEREVRRDYARALEQFEKCLRIAPGDAIALSGMALVEQALGREALIDAKHRVLIHGQVPGKLADRGNSRAGGERS